KGGQGRRFIRYHRPRLSIPPINLSGQPWKPSPPPPRPASSRPRGPPSRSDAAAAEGPPPPPP
uniref:Uncharacterized protein n=1 Tax=Aegilops tauschii subsp. strangulata TaxID=200361 RepID=A0A453MVI6_AEGTS